MPANGTRTPDTSLSIFSGRPLTRGERVQLALLIGAAAGLAAFLAFGRWPDMLARDFTFPWRGAQAVLGGENPYDVIRPSGAPPFDMWFMYPLTAALAVVPFAPLQVQAAGVLFTSLGAGTLVYAITSEGIGRLWVLCSVPFMLAVVLAQWSPILIAAAILTPLSPLLTCKPIGLALFAWRPSWSAAAGCALLVALAFVVQPTWLADWVRNSQTLTSHPIPVSHPIGMAALLALVRWRQPAARLVAVMALVPQNLYFYDQLPLLLVARKGRQTLALVALGWVAWWLTARECELGFYCGPEARIPVLSLLYLPATLVALVDGDTIAWIRKRVTKGPTRTFAPPEAGPTDHQLP